MPNGHRSKLKNRGKLYFIQEKDIWTSTHSIIDW